MSEIVSKIKYAMSLRTPQEEALSYLDAISSHCDYKKDSKDVVEAAASEYCEKQRKVKAEFDFPSFCYAMATGIGKTRLMGASIYYLYKTSVYKGYKQDKIEMRGDRAEMSDFPLYLNTVAGGLDRRDQTIGGFSFVVKIYAVPVVEIIG